MQGQEFRSTRPRTFVSTKLFFRVQDVMEQAPHASADFWARLAHYTCPETGRVFGNNPDDTTPWAIVREGELPLRMMVQYAIKEGRSVVPWTILLVDQTASLPPPAPAKATKKARASRKPKVVPAEVSVPA